MDGKEVINARTDSYPCAVLDEAISRCNMNLNAGADLVFIDGIHSREDIEKAFKGITGPLSVNLMDAVSGVKTELIPILELARMGVARVSIPVASILVAHKPCLAFFNALKHSTSGILKGQHEMMAIVMLWDIPARAWCRFCLAWRHCTEKTAR